MSLDKILYISPELSLTFQTFELISSHEVASA